MKARLVHLGVLLITLSSAFSWAQEINTEEQAVWRLEEDYWKYVKGQDLKRYLALWDERFVGWPSSSDSIRQSEHH